MGGVTMQEESARFSAQVRFTMLCTLLDGDLDRDAFCDRSGIEAERVEAILFDETEPTLREIGVWFWALNAETPRIELVKRNLK